jgi:hypothetical protein
MAVSGYIGPAPDPARLARHGERILYGTDFPNIPYDWDTELEWIRTRFDPPTAAKMLGGNALTLFD